MEKKKRARGCCELVGEEGGGERGLYRRVKSRWICSVRFESISRDTLITSLQNNWLVTCMTCIWAVKNETTHGRERERESEREVNRDRERKREGKRERHKGYVLALPSRFSKP